MPRLAKFALAAVLVLSCGSCKPDPEVVEILDAMVLMGYPGCFLQDPKNLSTRDIDLIVRTVNTCQGCNAFKTESGFTGPRAYPKRLKGMADVFYDDALGIGLIGMQEVKMQMSSCPYGLEFAYGADCFARILAHRYSVPESQVSSAGNLSELFRKSWPSIVGLHIGAVVGSPWEIVEWSWWAIGQDDCGNWFGVGEDTRYLLEMRVRHAEEGWELRFYNTHLSHDCEGRTNENRIERKKEVDEVIAKVHSRVSSGELPPVLVGDFNLAAGRDDLALATLRQHFVLINDLAKNADPAMCTLGHPPSDAGIDQIWVGRQDRFTQTLGSLVPIRWHTNMDSGFGIGLTEGNGPYLVDGVKYDRLSDHNAKGVTFKVVLPP